MTFSYPDREPILRNFDLEIPAGATIGLVGSTGSGKTTLINLLLRFYQPQGGKITLDGQALEDLDMKDLRGAIGLVSQHTFLFHGTVEENVAYGTFSAKRERVLDVIDSAEATEFVEDLPAGVETVVGERGETLSGGQRQRLSIARALLKDPPVLILDEATSAVDNETEAALQRSLDSISADRTTIVIAHRLSTVRNADMIVVLDGGRIAERGKHEELLEKNGIYARLWSVQTGDTDHRDQDRAG